MQRGRSSAWPWAWLLRLTSWKSSGEPAVIDRAIACFMALADLSMRCRGAVVRLWMEGSQRYLQSTTSIRDLGIPTYCGDSDRSFQFGTSLFWALTI